jgi:hypothetical protein
LKHNLDDFQLRTGLGFNFVSMKEGEDHFV